MVGRLRNAERVTHRRFPFLSLARIKQIMSPRFICILAPRVATASGVAATFTRGHGRAKRKWVSISLFFFSPPFSPRPSLLPFSSTFSRGDTSPRFPRVHFPLPPPAARSALAREFRTGECARSVAFDNLAHPDTNGYRRPFLSRDPYYSNAGALFAGWYRGDRNIPRHNEPQEQEAPSNESGPGESEIPSD